MTTNREARIRAVMDGPVGPPAADVLAAGTATITQAEDEEWDLVWFGSAAILTEGGQAEVAALKRVIMKFFLGRHPQAQHSWGRS